MYAVANFVSPDGALVIDTARVSEGRQPFETAVRHPAYNEGHWIVIEAYDSRAEAEAGHAIWVAELSRELPEYFRDCANAFVSQIIETISEQPMIFPKAGQDFDRWTLTVTFPDGSHSHIGAPEPEGTLEVMSGSND